MATQPSDAPSDRRRAPRVRTDIPTRVHADEPIEVRVVDLSLNGACAVTSRPLPEMGQLKIRVQAPTPAGEQLSVLAEAVVVRCDRRPDQSFDVGLFFPSLNQDERHTLARIIELHTALSLA